MVSQPNFVRGIKQTSLTSKRRFSRAYHHQKSHMLVCWIQISQHLVAAMAHYCVLILKAQAICASPYQIYAHQAFAWWNQQDIRAPRHIATKTQKPDLQRQPHAPPCADNGYLEHSHMPPRIQDFQIVFLAHVLPWRPPRPPIYRTWDSGPHPSLHALPGFLAYTSRAGGLSTRLPRAEKLLLMSSDVTEWHHRSTSACHTHHSPRHQTR